MCVLLFLFDVYLFVTHFLFEVCSRFCDNGFNSAELMSAFLDFPDKQCDHLCVVLDSIVLQPVAPYKAKC